MACSGLGIKAYLPSFYARQARRQQVARQRLEDETNCRTASASSSIGALAARAKMSARSFARAYVKETGVTPAKAIERLRVEAARALLDAGEPSVERIAARTGFGDAERMRRAFTRLYGAPPSAFRRAASSKAGAHSATSAGGSGFRERVK